MEILWTSAVAASTARSPFAFSFTGFGALKVGMTVRQAEKALKFQLTEDVGPDDDPAGCHYAGNAGQLPGIALMVESGRIVRIDVTDSRYQTARGARVGTPEGELRRSYPGIRTLPHKYDENGHYLVLVSPDQQFALLFETDGKVVTEFRVGLREPVDYVERCL